MYIYGIRSTRPWFRLIQSRIRTPEGLPWSLGLCGDCSWEHSVADHNGRREDVDGSNTWWRLYHRLKDTEQLKEEEAEYK